MRRTGVLLTRYWPSPPRVRRRATETSLYGRSGHALSELSNSRSTSQKSIGCAAGRACEQDVVGLLGAQLARAHRAGRPEDRVGDVRLPRPVRADHDRDPGFEVDLDRVDERLEPAQLDRFEVHARGGYRGGTDAAGDPRNRPCSVRIPSARRSLSSACWAAACSASFFERPCRRRTPPSMTAAAVNVRSCGGPSTSEHGVRHRAADAPAAPAAPSCGRRACSARTRSAGRTPRRPPARPPRSRARDRAPRARPRAAPRARCGCARAARPRRPASPARASREPLAQPQLPRDDGAARAGDDVRAHLRHPPLAELREPLVERPRDRELEHRVARGTRAARTRRCGRRPTTNA